LNIFYQFLEQLQNSHLWNFECHKNTPDKMRLMVFNRFGQLEISPFQTEKSRWQKWNFPTFCKFLNIFRKFCVGLVLNIVSKCLSELLIKIFRPKFSVLRPKSYPLFWHLPVRFVHLNFDLFTSTSVLRHFFKFGFISDREAKVEVKFWSK